MIFAPSLILGTIYFFTGFAQPPVPSILLFFLLAMPMFLFQIVVILKESKNTFGSYSLKSAFNNYEKMPFGKILIYAVVLFAFAGIMSVTITPLENELFSHLRENLNQITPEYFNWNNLENIKQYSSSVVAVTCIVYFLFNVFIFPIVEELFFRGYLTSKINRLGFYAPLIITMLFSLYHFWLPFDNIFRIFAFFPAAFIAWKKKNIYIVIVFHCLCNLFSTVSFIIAVYS
ncbi:MAG: CPBP family intramembrane glutamic endopeptidase [Spirochaetales bacterium]